MTRTEEPVRFLNVRGDSRVSINWRRKDERVLNWKGRVGVQSWRQASQHVCGDSQWEAGRGEESTNATEWPTERLPKEKRGRERWKGGKWAWNNTFRVVGMARRWPLPAPAVKVPTCHPYDQRKQVAYVLKTGYREKKQRQEGVDPAAFR